MKQKNGSGQERQVELSPRCIHDRVCRSSAEHCDCKDIKCPEYRTEVAIRRRVLNEAIHEINSELNITDRKWKGMMKSIDIIEKLRDKEKKEGPA